MQPLDLKKFVWNKDHKWYLILAITTFKGDDIVVYRESQDRAAIEIATVDDFCKHFQATYCLDNDGDFNS